MRVVSGVRPIVGLAKRALKGVPSIAVKTPEDIQAAVDMLENA